MDSTHSVKNHIQQLDFDTLIQTGQGYVSFMKFLKDLNNSSGKLLYLYIMCCYVLDNGAITRLITQRFKELLLKEEMPHLNEDIKQKLIESVQQETYDKALFKAAKNELRRILLKEYFVKFLNSERFRELNGNCALQLIK